MFEPIVQRVHFYETRDDFSSFSIYSGRLALITMLHKAYLRQISNFKASFHVGRTDRVKDGRNFITSRHFAREMWILQVGEMFRRWDFSFVHACVSFTSWTALIGGSVSAVVAKRPLPTLQVIKKERKTIARRSPTPARLHAPSRIRNGRVDVGHIYCLLFTCFSFAQKVDFFLLRSVVSHLRRFLMGTSFAAFRLI